MPDVIDGALRAVFFFSFFGRIVSELGLLRTLPLFPTALASLRGIWGIEVTVSVSTVIFLSASVLNDLRLVGTRREVGGADVVVNLNSPFPLLSLPLSFATLDLDLIVLVAESIGSGSVVNAAAPLCALSNIPSQPGPGVFG